MIVVWLFYAYLAVMIAAGINYTIRRNNPPPRRRTSTPTEE